MDQHREEFPFLQTCTYLDAASQGPLPLRTVRAIDEAVGKRSNPTLFGMDDAFELPSAVRSLVARLLHAGPGEIVLTHSTGHGINIAANCLELGEGDSVILSEGEFPSNVYPWLNLKRRGLDVRFVPTRNGFFDIETFEKMIDRHTKVLAVSSVQFFNGYRNDLDVLGAVCREHDICFFLDGSQAVGALDLDVRKTPVDMVASCGAKWLLSPMGSGLLYISDRILGTLHPENVGWLSFLGEPCDGAFDRLTTYTFRLPPDGRKFEVGSPLFLPLSGFRSSLELILDVGVEQIERHVAGLLDPLIDFLQASSFRLLSSLDPGHRSTILSFTSPDVHSLHAFLHQRGIFTSVREGGLRVSPHFYNTTEDMDRLIKALEQA